MIATMSKTAATNSRIVTAYRERTPKSLARHQEALDLFPSGIVHDSRKLDPYPVYVDRAAGARKWDIDGNEYVDYYGGHGSLLLGHCHPDIMQAVHAQIDRGSHPAACHELEVEWAKLIKRLVACAERVRFTASGTEANLMAFRLARAATGRDKIIRFRGHFHGWQDHVAFRVKGHQDGSPTPGVLAGIADSIILLDPDDVEGLEKTLRGRGDVAAVILEPTGASSGQAPVSKEFVEAVRRETAAAGVATLKAVVTDGVCERAVAQGEKLRRGMNRVFAEAGVAWAAYGDASLCYVHTNPGGHDIDPENFDRFALPWKQMSEGGGHPAAGRFRLALMNTGVDVSGKPGMIVSAVHSDDDIARTCEALRAALKALKEENEL